MVLFLLTSLGSVETLGQKRKRITRI